MSIGIQVYTMNFLIIIKKLHELEFFTGMSFNSIVQEYKIKIKFVKLLCVRYLARNIEYKLPKRLSLFPQNTILG